MISVILNQPKGMERLAYCNVYFVIPYIVWLYSCISRASDKVYKYLVGVSVLA